MIVILRGGRYAFAFFMGCTKPNKTWYSKPNEQMPQNGSKKRGSKENRKQNSEFSIIPIYRQVRTANG